MVRVKVFYINEYVAEIEDLFLEGDMDLTKREVAFFNIDAISPYSYKGQVYAMIHANGQEFVSCESYEVALKKFMHLSYINN